MSKNRPFKKHITVVLSIIVILGWMPVLAATQTDDPPNGAGDEMIAFEEPAPDAAFTAMTGESADYSWYDADSSASRFEISSEAQLKGLADIVIGNHGSKFDFSGRFIELTRDLDLSAYENWTPIGGGAGSFSGTFNGNHHIISNLTINAPGQNYIGLFGMVTGTVSNIGLSDVSIVGNDYVGGIAGFAVYLHSITDCSVTGGTVSGNGYVGGIAGKAGEQVISGLYILTNCDTTCDVTGTGSASHDIGGVVGMVYGNVTNCHAAGAVSGNSRVGGIAGKADAILNGSKSSLTDCYATGNVVGTYDVGGVAGWVNGTLTICHSAGAVSPTGGSTDSTGIGGVVGSIFGSVTNCYATGAVSGNGRIGGVAGKVGDSDTSVEGSLTSCYAIGNVFGVGFSPYNAGGVAGSVYGSITNCYSTGTVSPAGYSGYFTNAGGVVGSVNGSVTSCYAIGAVSGNMTIGGIAGSVSGYFGRTTTVKSCAALNISVTGDSSIGRVAGRGGNYTDISGNIAFSGMGCSATDGTGKGSAEITANGFFAANGFTAPAWDSQDGMLPILEGFPEGIQSGAVPAHLGALTPSAPRNLTAAHGDTQVTIQWVTPGSAGQSSIIRYEVCKDDGAWTSVGMDTSYTFTGLTNGTTYTLQVHAVNNNGNGAVASVQKSPGVVPSRPTNVTATPDSNRIILTWGAPSAPGTGDILFYEIRHAFGTSMPGFTTWVVASGQSTHTITGLTNGYTYTIQVRAINNYGSGNYQELTAKPAGRPSQPSSFMASAGDGQVSLSWGYPTDDGTSPVTGYEVLSPLDGTWIPVGAATSHAFTGLTNGTSYTLQVRAVNAIGTGSAASLAAVPRQAPAITSADSKNAVYGDGGSFQVSASGTPPFTFSLSGQPGGVSIDGETGRMTVGKTTPVGTYTFTITVANGQLPNATQSFTLTVASRVPQTSDLQYDIPLHHVYDGANIGIGEVLDKNAIGLTVTVYYEGTGDTVYTKSQTPPKTVGTYQVTAKIAPTVNIQTAELLLGIYEIYPRELAVTPVAGQKKEYGQPDLALSYTLSPSLVSGDSLEGSLSRAIGEDVGEYLITMGDLHGDSNYVLNLSGIVYFEITKATRTAPSAPTMAERTSRSVTLTTVAGAEYRKGENGAWQSSPLFEGLNPDTPYVFYTKLIETATHKESPASPSSGLILTLELIPQAAPAAPEMLDRTSTSITLSAITGAEYRKEGGGWQADTEFVSLAPNTAYTFYARMKETDTHASSPQSEAMTVYTDKAILSGNVSISGNAVYGRMLSADVAGLVSNPAGEMLGTLFYQWRRNGMLIVGAVGEEYTLTQADIGATITLTVASENLRGEKTSDATAPVSKASQGAPSVSGEIVNDGQTYTYGITSPISGAEFRMDSGDWQDSPVFSGIIPGAEATHAFYARLKETDTHLPGDASSTGTVSFPKLTPSKPELHYTISGGFPAKIVAIQPVEGAEYQFNGSGYVPDNTYISTETEDVILDIRFKETDTHNASASESVIVSTVNLEQSTPTAFSLSYTGADETHYIVTIPPTEGAEYSFDGSGWSAVNSKSDCEPNQTITGYKRMAEKPGFNASAAASSSLTLPLFQVKTPAISPNGGTFTGSRSITISCETSGAVIYYTTDGTEPTAGSTPYNSSFPLTATATVKAIAIKSGMRDSDVMAVTFTRQTDVSFSSSTGGSSTGNAVVAIAPEESPNHPVTAAVEIIAVIGTDGMADVSLSHQAVADAIRKALDEADKLGKAANGIGVLLDVKMPENAESLSLSFSQAGLQSLVDANVKSLELEGDIASLSFDLEALKEIRKQSAGGVTISFTPVTELSNEARMLIGTRPVYNITISHGDHDRAVDITSLGQGNAVLSIPYIPNRNEAVGWLFAVYVDDNGNASRIPGSAYDANSRSIIVPTGHFSTYGVGYTSPTEKYTDITNHWAREGIDYAVGYSLFSGITDTQFAPNATMSRGMLIEVLGKLAGADVSAYKQSSFSDVAVGKYYLPYIEWAYKFGIVKGVGNNRFAPERAVTREEIALILQNYARVTDFTLPVIRETIPFTDSAIIGSSYREAVRAMQEAGIMVGGRNNKFEPKAGATRAEVASVLHRYARLTIDPATAQGWTQNNEGQWFCYRDGKPLTGWQILNEKKYFFSPTGAMQIGWKQNDKGNWLYLAAEGPLVGWQDIGGYTDQRRYYFDMDAIMVSGKWLKIGGRWYYFYADGSLAVSTMIDGYEVDTNGVRKTE